MNAQNSKNKNKENVAASSVLAGFVLTSGKFVIGLMTGSMGILSEAAHSLLDMGAAIITYFAVRVSGEPADEEHHFGHGKIEAFSALIETILLFLTSGWIIYEALDRLLSGDIEVEATWYAFAVVIVSIIIDWSRSRALMRVAKETGSQALEADALHFRTDIWSSAVVFAGLICVLYGIKGADAIAALFVAFIVMKVGYDMGKRTFDVLIDTAPEGIAEKTKETLLKIPGVVGTENIRARMVGPNVYIDALLVVGRKLNAEALHELIEKAKAAIHAELPSSEILIHTRSVQLSTETIVESIHILGHKHGFPVHHVTVHTEEGKKFISCDLEVARTLSLKEAHDRATHFEKLIAEEIGEEAEISTHIDPSEDRSLESTAVSNNELNRITREIKTVMLQIPMLSEAHNILAQRAEKKVTVSVHCYADPEMPIEEAHEYASRLEHLLTEKEELHIERAVIHVEPRKNEYREVNYP
ncbi:MAG: cation diffusion facilitator family transporter [Candidatus Paceibacterota bacterium]|jgi:cation diffusion facilitator family transporter|nr:cation-efflux pump [Candidatus Paceibacterota bacterium]